MNYIFQLYFLAISHTMADCQYNYLVRFPNSYYGQSFKSDWHDTDLSMLPMLPPTMPSNNVMPMQPSKYYAMPVSLQAPMTSVPGSQAPFALQSSIPKSSPSPKFIITMPPKTPHLQMSPMSSGMPLRMRTGSMPTSMSMMMPMHFPLRLPKRILSNPISVPMSISSSLQMPISIPMSTSILMPTYTLTAMPIFMAKSMPMSMPMPVQMLMLIQPPLPVTSHVQQPIRIMQSMTSQQFSLSEHLHPTSSSLPENSENFWHEGDIHEEDSDSNSEEINIKNPEENLDMTQDHDNLYQVSKTESLNNDIVTDYTSEIDNIFNHNTQSRNKNIAKILDIPKNENRFFVINNNEQNNYTSEENYDDYEYFHKSQLRNFDYEPSEHLKMNKGTYLNKKIPKYNTAGNMLKSTSFSNLYTKYEKKEKIKRILKKLVNILNKNRKELRNKRSHYIRKLIFEDGLRWSKISSDEDTI